MTKPTQVMTYRDYRDVLVAKGISLEPMIRRIPKKTGDKLLVSSCLPLETVK